MKPGIDRILGKNGDGAENEAESKELVIENHGKAKLEGEVVIVYGIDETELFRFNSKACGFEEQPIRFLVEVYMVGYNKGRLHGRVIARALVVQALGVEQ